MRDSLKRIGLAAALLASTLLPACGSYKTRESSRIAQQILRDYHEDQGHESDMQSNPLGRDGYIAMEPEEGVDYGTRIGGPNAEGLNSGIAAKRVNSSNLEQNVAKAPSKENIFSDIRLFNASEHRFSEYTGPNDWQRAQIKEQETLEQYRLQFLRDQRKREDPLHENTINYERRQKEISRELIRYFAGELKDYLVEKKKVRLAKRAEQLQENITKKLPQAILEFLVPLPRWWEVDARIKTSTNDFGVEADWTYEQQRLAAGLKAGREVQLQFVYDLDLFSR